jgi:peptidoglycan hydrolase-like protein with peptidoglycan-binding domain
MFKIPTGQLKAAPPIPEQQDQDDFDPGTHFCMPRWLAMCQNIQKPTNLLPIAMTNPKTSVPWGHDPASSWNAWTGAGFAATPPAHDLYAPQEQFGEYKDHFLGGRLLSGPPVNTYLPILGQPVGPSLLTRVVSPGSIGDEVSQLQQFLNGRLDPSPGLLDNGQYDAKTLEAVMAFQKASGINPTGKVEVKTWFKLLFGGRVAWPRPATLAQKNLSLSSSRHSVAGWSVKDKFGTVILEAGLLLPGDLRFTFGQVVDHGTRQSLAMIFATWAGALVLTNGNEGIDFGLRALAMGKIDVEALGIIEDLNSFLTATSNASQKVHLDRAATYLARVVTRTGVSLFLALVHRIATKHDANRSEIAPLPAGSKGGAGKPVDMRPSEPKAKAAVTVSPKKAPPKQAPVIKPVTRQTAAMKKARDDAAGFVEVCP